MSLEQQLAKLLEEAYYATDKLVEYAKQSQQKALENSSNSIRYIQRAITVSQRNRIYYDKKINILKLKIEFENISPGTERDKLAEEIKHMHAAFQITKNYCATDEDILYFVFTHHNLHVMCPIQTNEYYYCKKVKGYIAQIRRCITKNNTPRIYKLFRALLALYDLRKSMLIDKCIRELYSIASQMTQRVGPVQEFIDLYVAVYAIPEYTEKVKVLKCALPVPEDNICDILSFVNDGPISRYEVDTMVYSTV